MKKIVSIAVPAAIAVGVLACAIALRAAEASRQVPYAYPGSPGGPVDVPRSVLQRYEGEWVYPAGNSVTVRLHGDTLFREIPGQQVPLVPVSETVFRLGAVFTAEFITDLSGQVTQIVSDGAAVEYRLHRKGVKPAALPAPTAALRVPKPVLERYAGRYEYVAGQMGRTDLYVEVRLKGDTLSGLTSGLREAVLTPISETRFRLGTTAIVWAFEIDEAGTVTLSMGSGFQQLKARRTSAH